MKFIAVNRSYWMMPETSWTSPRSFGRPLARLFGKGRPRGADHGHRDKFPDLNMSSILAKASLKSNRHPIAR